MNHRNLLAGLFAPTMLSFPTLAQDPPPLGDSHAVAQHFLHAVAPGVASDDFAAPIFDDGGGDGSVWVRGRNYKAHVDRDGLTFVPFLGSRAPHDYPVTFRLRSASIGSQTLQLAFGAPPVRDERRVYVEHGSVTEILDFTADDVEQSFVVRRGEVQGELALHVDVDTSLKRAATPTGLWFGCAKGAVHSGWAASRDAFGYELATTSLPDHDGLEFVVPADEIANARGEITIDPIISTAITDGSGIDDFDPDVAYDAQSDMYLLVYDETYSQTDHDVRSQFVSGATGQPIANTLAYIDVSTADWRQPAVANQASSHQFLVASSVAPSPEQIQCRTRLANSTSMGNQFVISTNTTGGTCDVWEYRRHVAPTVSGDPNPATGNPFIVAWVCNLIHNVGGLGWNYQAACPNLYAAAVSSSGGIGAPVWVAGSVDFEGEPTIDQSWPTIANGKYESTSLSKSIGPKGAVLAWHNWLNNFNAERVIAAWGVTASSNLVLSLNNGANLVDFLLPLPGNSAAVGELFSALSVSSVRKGLGGPQFMVAFDAPGPAGGTRLYGALVDYNAIETPGVAVHPALYDLCKLEELAAPGSTFSQWTPSVDSDGSNYAVSFEASTVGGNALACAEFAFQSPNKLTEKMYCDEPQLLLTTPTAMPMGRSRACAEKSGGGTRLFTLIGSTRFGTTGSLGDPFIAMHSH